MGLGDTKKRSRKNCRTSCNQRQGDGIFQSLWTRKTMFGFVEKLEWRIGTTQHNNSPQENNNLLWIVAIAGKHADFTA